MFRDSVEGRRLSLPTCVCFQGVQNELSTREPELRQLLDRGQRIVEQSSATLPASADLPATLDAAKASWRSDLYPVM